MWDCQAEALEGQFRILRYDRRGHGLSSSPPPPFSMAELGRDVLHLMDSLGIERTHFCGLSIGGLLGQWLALHAAHRFDKIVLCATAARIGSAQSWTERMNAVSAHGLSPLLAGTWSDGLRPDLPPQHREWSTPVLHHSSRRQSAAMSDAAQPLPTQISERPLGQDLLPGAGDFRVGRSGLPSVRSRSYSRERPGWPSYQPAGTAHRQH